MLGGIIVQGIDKGFGAANKRESIITQSETLKLCNRFEL